jgi:hypothetical protein
MASNPARVKKSRATPTKKGSAQRRRAAAVAAEGAAAPASAMTGAETIEIPAADGFAPEQAEPVGRDAALEHAAAQDAAEGILGANPLIGIDRAEILDAAQRALRLALGRPKVLLEEHVGLARQLVDVHMSRRIRRTAASPTRSGARAATTVA